MFALGTMLNCHRRVPGQNDSAGIESIGLGGLRVRVTTCGKGITKNKGSTRYYRELNEYKRLLSAHRSGTMSADSFGQAQKVDQKTYHKDGIAHEIG